MKKWVMGAVAAITLAAIATPAMAKDRWEKIFDGKTLTGWTLIGKGGRGYVV